MQDRVSEGVKQSGGGCMYDSGGTRQSEGCHLWLLLSMSTGICTCQLATHMMRFIEPIQIGLFFWGFYPFPKVCNLLNILNNFSCQKKTNKRLFCLVCREFFSYLTC